MIVDTSAIVAILRDEPGADRYIDALSRVEEPLISPGTYLEAAIVIDSNRDPGLIGRLDDLLAESRVKVEPLTRRHAEIARQAYRAFRKGSEHPAELNLQMPARDQAGSQAAGPGATGRVYL
ncbi:MAG TPA: type II toxin-antitoxin system VapC family toxin [Candidatus Acidoferrales bacterium]|nr:type II toxin-antitoxin system VapC family toxin [Candidatus Acidoferrales bacterium]